MLRFFIFQTVIRIAKKIEKNIMETIILGYWNEKKEKIKQRFTGVTDDDLNFREGKEKEMMEMLEYKLGVTKLELAKIIEAL